MPYTVEGSDITAGELSDGTWTAFEMQRRYRRPSPPEQQPAGAQTPATTLSAPNARQRGRPPPPTKKRPLPRLPSDDLKIVLRPQGTLNLHTVGPARLAVAIYAAANVDQRLAVTADQVRMHPTNNTVTVSTPDSARAVSYAKVRAITIDTTEVPVAAYAPAPDNSVRGILYRAYSYESDAEIFAELRARNPDIPIVAARRMGQTRHFVVTFANTKLPRYMRYLGFTFEVFPYKGRPEACFNCRKLGHRTDVCPQPRQPICRCCGVAHEPQPVGQPPTCQATCIVCKGPHPTGSRSCKYRFVPTSRAKSSKSSTDTETDPGTLSRGHQSRSRSRDRQQRPPGNDAFPPLRSSGSIHNSPSRSPSRSRDSRATSQVGPDTKSTKQVAWKSPPPATSQLPDPQSPPSACSWQLFCGGCSITTTCSVLDNVEPSEHYRNARTRAYSPHELQPCPVPRRGPWSLHIERDRSPHKLQSSPSACSWQLFCGCCSTATRRSE
ncbi:uncharacterized protein [Dermacentor albipictus]